jgi:uncharacterized protein (DUF305 family)
MQDNEMLNYICQNAEMGRDSIMHVIKLTDDPKFRGVLETQLTEYQGVYDTADSMLKQRGGDPESVGPMAKMASYVTSSMKTMADNSPSHIAEMMIQGSTMGITKMTKRIHEYDGDDPEVKKLAEKQIKTEQANIEEMKKFLS